jgi:hypothetical protein
VKTLSDGLSEVAALAYGWLPRPLRRVLLPVALPGFALARRIPLLASQVRQPVWRVEGAEKGRGRRLVLLVCSRAEGLAFVSDLALARVERKERLGSACPREVPRLASRLRGSVDLAFFHSDIRLARPLAGRGFFLLPEWVDLGLDLSRPLGEVWARPGNKSLRENLRRIRKYGYGYEISTAREAFDRFYSEMYLPFIPDRFGEGTRVVGPRLMRRFFEGGVLLLVKRGGEPVAGNIIVLAGGEALSLVAGLRRGDPVLLKQSALAAGYYFTLLWAEARRLRRVNFGGCRPLLKDGLVYFKKSWGMSVAPSGSARNVYGLGLVRPSPAAIDFLERNPFIRLQGSRLRGFVLAGRHHPLSLTDVRAVSHALDIPGLDGLDLLSQAGFGPEVGRAAVSGPGGRMALHEGPVGEFFRAGL